MLWMPHDSTIPHMHVGAAFFPSRSASSEPWPHAMLLYPIRPVKRRELMDDLVIVQPRRKHPGELKNCQRGECLVCLIPNHNIQFEDPHYIKQLQLEHFEPFRWKLKKLQASSTFALPRCPPFFVGLKHFGSPKAQHIETANKALPTKLKHHVGLAHELGGFCGSKASWIGSFMPICCPST